MSPPKSHLNGSDIVMFFLRRLPAEKMERHGRFYLPNVTGNFFGSQDACAHPIIAL
jgi:hypothetical protein